MLMLICGGDGDGDDASLGPTRSLSLGTYCNKVGGCRQGESCCAGVWMTRSLAGWLAPRGAAAPFAYDKSDRASGWDSASPGAQGQRCSAAIDSPAQSGTAGGITARVPQVTALAWTIHFLFAV
jgi:hypothetical protein